MTKKLQAMNNRVVITGMGVVSPLGLTLSTTWEALVAGKSGVDYIKAFDPEHVDTKIAAEVKDFDPTQFLSHKKVRYLDRFVQLAVAASAEALRNANLQINSNNAEQVGVVIGSAIGGIRTMEAQNKIFMDRGLKRVSPFVIPMSLPDAAAVQVAITLGSKGINYCTTSACASSSDAIGLSMEIIRSGDAQVIIAGGADAAISPMVIAGFNAARALSTRNHVPQKASCPFDLERDGFVMGEGAAILILENLSFARTRGAPILAEVASFGSTCDAFHITQPTQGGEEASRAMKIALDKANVKPEEVDYINAHGTSTPMNDRIETLAIKKVFGSHAYKLAISSTKSMVGHLLGAAGAFEAASCILAIQHGMIPPTINLEHHDPDCDLDYVPNVARPAEIRVAMSNSFAFGGHNSILVFRQYR